MSVTSIRHPSTGLARRGSAPAQERRDERISRPSLVLTTMVVMLLAAGAWWVTRSAIFEARTVTVTGTRQLTAAQVLRLAGIDRHTNVVWFSPGRVERRLESNPWIGRARVSRTLPSTISISIRERTPVAILAAGGRRYLVAGDGMIVGETVALWRLPVIQASGTATMRPGSTDRADMGEVRVLQALPPRIRRKVREIGTVPGQGLVLRLVGGIRALYGDATDPDAKAGALMAVMDWAAANHVALAYVDARAPATPAAGPVSAAAVPQPVTSPRMLVVPSPQPSVTASP